ncbi:MAG: cell division protein SepF [Candidatus Diapherotrites archaeon]|nr:cell division protein SepF [Candidatus Diapherotrites archaeon]
MAFLEKVLKKSDSIDIEDFLNNLDVEDETLYEDADAYVKPVSLNTPEDVNVVLNEAKAGNVVLLNIGGLNKRNVLKLKELITQIRTGVEQINGDIARISQDRVLVTPSKVKIVKSKEQ